MIDKAKKKFRLTADQIKEIASNRGYCLCSDEVTVDGKNVAYMRREVPEERGDSGWQFFSGVETEEYIDNPDNFAIYDINTIANYDPEIIPFLDAYYPAEYMRDSDGRFQLLEPEL